MKRSEAGRVFWTIEAYITPYDLKPFFRCCAECSFALPHPMYVCVNVLMPVCAELFHQFMTCLLRIADTCTAFHAFETIMHKSRGLE